MPKVNTKQARAFLENISPQEKVIIIHDSDPDGIISGILFLDFLKKRGVQADHAAFTYGQTFDEVCDPKEYEVIILTDVGLNNETIREIKKYKNKKFLYNDHHKRDQEVPKEIYDYHTSSGLCSARNAFDITNGKDWLALIGIIADAGDLYKENEKIINTILKKYNYDLETFKKDYVYLLSSFLTYLNDFDKAFNILKEKNSLEDLHDLKKYAKPIEDEIKKHLKNFEKKKEIIEEATFYYFEPAYKVKPAVTDTLTRASPNTIFLIATPSSDKKSVSISARNQTRRISMPELLKEGIKGLKEANAGGHIPAAGAKIKKEDLETFKENIKNYLKKI